jgi:CHAD domain-containing protein
MSYELQCDETLADGVQRICRTQIAKAIDIVSGRREITGSPVHETRKCVKKARAALRLVRKEIGRSSFRQQDHWLRDVARLVSELRDAEVRLETIKDLQSIQPARGRSLYRQVEHMLRFELENFLAGFAEWQSQAVPLLQQALTAIDSWTVHHFNGRQLRRAVQKSYKKARNRLSEARKDMSPETFHEFRRAAKMCSHQIRALRVINPVVLENLSDELKAVTDLLGRSHDLTFLANRLRRDGEHTASARDCSKLLAVLEITQSDLQRAAGDLADHFFAERPRDFGARLDLWLNEWTNSNSTSVAEALTL